MEKKYKKLLYDMADSVSLNEETANHYLQSEKVDINYYVSKGLKEIAKKEFLRKAESTLEKHQYLIERALNKIKNAVPETLTNIENAIKIKQPAFQFRNLQELDEIQLREILDDIDLINAIEELDI